MGDQAPRAGVRRALRFLALVVGLAGVWVVLQEGQPQLGLAAVASVLAAAVVALRLAPAPRADAGRLRPLGLVRFVPFFLMESVRGGVDVAWRALSPRLPLRLGFVDWPLRLPPGAARTLFVATVSLLPGTLSAALSRGVLRVHALDTDTAGPALRRLEREVARLFSLPVDLSAPSAAGSGEAPGLAPPPGAPGAPPGPPSSS